MPAPCPPRTALRCVSTWTPTGALAVAAWDWADAQGRSGEAVALELPEIEVIEP